MKGRKRQLIVDTDGRGLILVPQPADVQDREEALILLHLSRRSFPFIATAVADSVYAGRRAATATAVTRRCKETRQSGRLRGSSGAGWSRFDQRKPVEGPGSDARLSTSLPLRGLYYGPRPPTGCVSRFPARLQGITTRGSAGRSSTQRLPDGERVPEWSAPLPFGRRFECRAVAHRCAALLECSDLDGRSRSPR